MADFSHEGTWIWTHSNKVNKDSFVVLRALVFLEYFYLSRFVVNFYTSLKEVDDVFWGKGSPESSQGNNLDCAFLDLQEDNQLVWKDMACGWVAH